MDDFITLARSLITVGLALLLIMLRLDAEKFGTAEYYEATRDGERPRVRRRLGWYGLGFGLAIAILYIHPSPQADLFLGSGNRLGAVLGGLAYGLIGIAVAVGFATYRYHRIRFPEPWSYPGALLNSTATAFIDEAAFRGALFGLLLVAGVNPTLANLIQAILYALTTRLGAPGRDRYLLFADARDGPDRRLADGRDRRDRRGIPRPLHHPLLVASCAPATPARRSHAPASPRRSRSDAAHQRAGGSSGRGSRPRATGERVAGSATAGRGPNRRSRSTSTSRSASRSVRTATSSSTRGRPRADRRRASRPSSARSQTELDLRADALDAAFGAGRPPLETVYLGGGTPSLLPAEAVAGLVVQVRDRFGVARRRGGHARGQPGPGRARRRRPPCVRPASRGCRSVRRPCPPSAASSRPAAPRRRRRDRGRGCARRRDRIGQPRPAVRRPRCVARRPGSTRSTRRSRSRPDHLSLYALTLDDPDAEGLTGPGGDHLPTTRGRSPLARRRPARPGRGSGGGAIPPRRPPAGRRRLARLRDQQLGAAGAREPAQPRLLGASAVRGGRARARTRSMASPGAGTRHDSMATSRRWLRPTAASRSSRPAAPRRSTPRPPPPRRSSSVCGPIAASRWPRRRRRRSWTRSAGRWPPSSST